MRVYFIRHGEMQRGGYGWWRTVAEHNRALQESPKWGLTERGKIQAQRAAEFLAVHAPGFLYSSPMQRAFETAQIAAERLKLLVEVRQEFQEIDQGMLTWQLKMRVPAIGLYLFYRLLWMLNLIEADEGRRAALERIRISVTSLVKRHRPDDKIAVFTHGFFMSLLRLQVLSRRPSLIRGVRLPLFSNCAVMMLEIDQAGNVTALQEWMT